MPLLWTHFPYREVYKANFMLCQSDYFSKHNLLLLFHSVSLWLV
jgi:hypothetical protein